MRLGFRIPALVESSSGPYSAMKPASREAEIPSAVTFSSSKKSLSSTVLKLKQVSPRRRPQFLRQAVEELLATVQGHQMKADRTSCRAGSRPPGSLTVSPCLSMRGAWQDRGWLLGSSTWPYRRPRRTGRRAAGGSTATGQRALQGPLRPFEPRPFSCWLASDGDLSHDHTPSPRSRACTASRE